MQNTSIKMEQIYYPEKLFYVNLFILCMNDYNKKVREKMLQHGQ